MEFKKGDVLQHKATLKRCVVIEAVREGKVAVTTEDDEYREYLPHELEKYGDLVGIVG